MGRTKWRQHNVEDLYEMIEDMIIRGEGRKRTIKAMEDFISTLETER
jgi:hypothetical protein